MFYIVSNFIIMKDTSLLICKLICFGEYLPFDVPVTGWRARKLCAEFVPLSSWEQF